MPKRLAAAFVLIATLGLGGCNWQGWLEDSRVQKALSGDPEAKKTLAERIQDPSRAQAVWGAIEAAYLDDFVFLPDNYLAMMTKDTDSFLKYVIGGMLYRYNVSFEQAAQYNIKDEALFNYYKGFGAAYSESIRNDPRQAWMKERLEMFKARAGRINDMNTISWFSAWKLLRNDDEFKRYLTEDAFAGNWFSANRSEQKQGAKIESSFFYESYLGPINSGVLPNASP
jgi:hypothetical protein